MKRIVAAMMWGICVSMLFTGCSSLMGSMEVNSKVIGSSVAVEEATGASQEDIRLNYTDEERNQVPPDYFSQNMENRFEGLSGAQAFQIKAGHCAAQAEGMEDFQIGGLREDGTFIYGYVTRLEQESKPRPMVHCGAMYNYKTGSFQVFHETQYARDGEASGQELDGAAGGEESFFLQACPSENGVLGDIFVYDNGEGYLYSGNGDLKFHADVEAFVRAQYADAYDVAITHAVTDGAGKIYMELSVEHEQVDMAPLEEELSDEEMERRTEELDREMEEKSSEVVMVYGFDQMNSYLNQDNQAFESQKAAWIAMTDGEEFEETPSISGDWDRAVMQHPDSWSGAVLSGLGNLPVYQWKAEEVFLLDPQTDLCLFLAEPSTYTPFYKLQGNALLEAVFTVFEGSYSILCGKTGNLEYYNPERMERRYTLVWYEEETNENGETSQVKHSQRRVQSKTVNRSRRARLTQAYIERYWLLDSQKASVLGNLAGEDLICCGADGTVYRLSPQGEFKETGISLGEDARVGAIQDGETAYMVISWADSLMIAKEDGAGGVEDMTVVSYQSLGGGYKSGDTAYDDYFASLNEEDSLDGDVYSGGAYYTEEHVVQADLNVGRELAAALGEHGLTGLWPREGGTMKGFLLTSESRGLTYYDPGRGEGFVLAQGSWYRSWKQGDTIVSVGFANGDSSYTSLDIANARVYEYSLDTLCREAMEAALAEAVADEEKAARRASEEAAKETDGEGITPPMEEWNREYKEKYTLPGEGTEQGP